MLVHGAVADAQIARDLLGLFVGGDPGQAGALARAQPLH